MAVDVKELVAGIDPAQLAQLSAKVAGAASVDEVIELVAQVGKRIGAEEAQTLIDAVKEKASEEISIDELDNVAGGCDNPCCTYHC